MTQKENKKQSATQGVLAFIFQNKISLGIFSLLAATLGAITINLTLPEVAELLKFRSANKLELLEVNGILIKKSAESCRTHILSSEVELVNKSLVKVDHIIDSLNNDITMLEDRIVMAYEKGDNITADLARLKATRAELKGYLSRKAQENSLIQDTIVYDSGTALEYKNLLGSKRHFLDSLEMEYSIKVSKCD